MASTAEPPVDFVSELPSHLAQQVLARLDHHRDFAAAGCVCPCTRWRRRWWWRRVVQEEAVWLAGYGRRFPGWGCERTLRGAADWQEQEQLSWQERYRWRLGVERAWRQGRRHLVHALGNHAAWVNAVRLVPGGGGVASGGSEGAVNVWSLAGEPLLHDTTHSQAVWSLDADRRLVVSGKPQPGPRKGGVQVLDLERGEVALRLPAGWGGLASFPPDEADWPQFDVVTSVQLLPCGQQVLAGCMDGALQLLDLRSRQPAAQQLAWAQGDAATAAAAAFPWQGAGSSGGARLCAARCHEHLVVAGGDVAAVSLHDLRMGGARFAELALPAGAHALPAVFAMDLLYPRLATGGDGAGAGVWDLTRLDAAPGVLPAVPPAAAQPPPRVLAVPKRPARQGRRSSAAAVDCLFASNEYSLRHGLHMGCVYDVKLLEDGRLLSADHAGHVRQWSSGELVGGRHRHHCLTLGPAFAPSVDDPASALIDLELRGCERLCGGPMRPVGMHCLDACLTHLAVAGRDSVVRLYRYGQ
ncbi:hypothetical protein CHLNCDRAFT_132966 [Chlorella variabilis]|uniref:Uncharacterized protein n=1 Tax=Chlorella variabilis TaxID=554065 RepID=E1Z218_CHLVA|nr:hypothetical protein CHLNCDRAFT_132966 [Chlorella variabilis]EFN59918.1 hypothetical protein CHLNCDRAFT_132966 [Chlorella variabilis]|eukprot:XP_005852020.1 hypothetical protein CHLNCDRAFT_132966 [Chlorella variabilis]